MCEEDKKTYEILVKNARDVVNKAPMNKLSKKFAFYGSLREGHYNYNALVAKDPKKNKVETTTLKGFKMFSFGAFPFVVKTGNENDTIVVELFDLDDELIIKRIHMMEVGAGYGIEEVTVNDQTYWLYVYPDRDYEKRGYERVTHGDWSKYKGVTVKTTS